MTPTITLDFLGSIISIKVDSDSNFLYIFKSLRILYDNQLAIHRRVPPAEGSVEVCSKEWLFNTIF